MKTIKKRTLKKKVGKKQEITEIVTIHEQNKEPQTTITVVESEVPEEDIGEIEPHEFNKEKSKKIVEEIPSDVKISEVISEEQTPEKSIKKRVIKKKVGKKQEIIEIVRIEEENKEPVVSVSISEISLDTDTIQETPFETLKSTKCGKFINLPLTIYLIILLPIFVFYMHYIFIHSFDWFYLMVCFLTESLNIFMRRKHPARQESTFQNFVHLNFYPKEKIYLKWKFGLVKV